MGVGCWLGGQNDVEGLRLMRGLVSDCWVRKHSISLDEILEIGVWFVVCGGKIDIVGFTIFITNSVQLSSSVFLQFS
jgi:hypothetical protein